MDRGVLDQFRHLLRPLGTRIANMVVRGVVQLADDGKKLQLLQVGALAGETVDAAEFHQAYGFSSVPLGGAEAVVVFPNGDRGHPLAIAVSDRRYRPSGGEAGQVTIYHYKGAKVTMLESGDIQVLPGTGGKVLLASPTAADGAVKGTTRNTAEQTFLTAMTTFVAAVTPTTGAPSAAISAFSAAITAFAAELGSTISTDVLLK